MDNEELELEEEITEEEYLSKKGRYLYISFTTKNPKTKRDYDKALIRLEKQWKAQKYKSGEKYGN